MLKHIVMWKLKEDDEVKKKENALLAKQSLENLVHKIPELKKAEVGINTNPAEAAYDLVLYSEFENEDDLAVYQSHPEHVKVGGLIKLITQRRAMVDYLVD